MSKTIIPKIKAFEVSESNNNIAIVFKENNDPLVFTKDRLALLNLMDGQRDIKALWDDLQSQKSPIKLSEVYLTLEKLKKAGALEDVAEKGYFKKNWLDFSFFKVKICNSKKTAVKSTAAFLTLSGAILLLSLLSIPLIYFNLHVHGFLQMNNSFLFAAPLLVVVFSVLAIFKGLLKGLLIMLVSGSWPATVFCFRGIMFDLEINESMVLTEQAFVRRIYHLTKAFCFLFLGVAASSFIASDVARQIEITALLMTFIWLNPLRKSEFTQAISSFFNDEEIRHLMPFLRKKSLAIFSKGNQNLPLEKKLIIFSSLSLVWIFTFIDFIESLISSNYGFWHLALTSGNIIEKLSAGLLALAVTALAASLLFDFIKTISLNIFSRLSRKINKFLQKQKPFDSTRFDKKQLEKFFSTLSFFSNLKEKDLQQLTSIISLKSYPKGTPIIIEGEIANEMFVIIEGEARVEKETESGFKQQFAVLETGAVFGEIGLIESCKRTADVITNSNVTLAIITKKDFNEIFMKDGSDAAISLKQKISLTRYLSSSIVFKGLPLETLQLFIKKGTFESVKPDNKIVTQGSLDKDFYLLLEGRVAVIRDAHRIAELLPGDFFGEIALFQNSPRIADVCALEKCSLLKLNKDSFWEVLAENMELTFSLEIVSQNRSGAF